MLVLTRKVNESLLIGEDIVITVVEIKGDKVRLGIEAPKEIPIARSEIAPQSLQARDTEIRGPGQNS
jgi:carbon storage regulator